MPPRCAPSRLQVGQKREAGEEGGEEAEEAEAERMGLTPDWIIVSAMPQGLCVCWRRPDAGP